MAISIAFWHLSQGKDSGHFSKDDFFGDLQIFLLMATIENLMFKQM